MFFQSVYAQFTISGVTSDSVQLWVNQNALSSTYIGNAATTTAADPFTVRPITTHTDTDSSKSGLPTVSALVSGVTPTS